MKKSMLPTLLIAMTIFATLMPSCTEPPVTTTILYHSPPHKMPDGSFATKLWRMTPDGGNVIQIPSSGWYGEYSPDNSRIAYSEFYDNGIWVVNADGTNPFQLTTSGSAPSWSPDGSQLVFHVGGTKGADHRLWIMNADGTKARKLSNISGSFPDWSPLGDKILFHGEVNNGIWSINQDGSNPTLFYRQGGYPAWSPDGKQIVYVDLVDWCIWVMDADGRNKKKLTDHKGLQPTWSADSLQIAYEHIEKNKSGIWVINADGSGDHKINDEGSHPDWSN